MMLKISDVIAWLKTKYPGMAAHNSTIPKNTPKCVGVYLNSRGNRVIAIGGYAATSRAVLPLTLLVHWTQDADACEQQANDIYEMMQAAEAETIGGHRIIDFDLQDPGPVDVDRDGNNICEMVIRVNVSYER